MNVALATKIDVIEEFKVKDSSYLKEHKIIMVITVITIAMAKVDEGEYEVIIVTTRPIINKEYLQVIASAITATIIIEEEEKFKKIISYLALVLVDMSTKEVLLEEQQEECCEFCCSQLKDFYFSLVNQDQQFALDLKICKV